MNPHTPPSDQNHLTPAERELAALYARMPKAEPDAALDAAILRQAATAVRPAPSRRYAPRWLLSAASAAVLVLAAGLVWRMQALPPELPVTASPATEPAPDSHRATARSRAEEAKPTPGHSDDAAPSTAAAAEAQPPPPPSARVLDARKQAKRASSERAIATPPPPPLPPLPPPPQAKPAAPAPPAQAADIVSTNVAGQAVEPPSSDNEPRSKTSNSEATNFAEQGDSPITQVANIRRLLREGYRNKAIQATETLHRDHPDFELPSDLAALLRLQANPPTPESSP